MNFFSDLTEAAGLDSLGETVMSLGDGLDLSSVAQALGVGGNGSDIDTESLMYLVRKNAEDIQKNREELKRRGIHLDEEKEMRTYSSRVRSERSALERFTMKPLQAASQQKRPERHTVHNGITLASAGAALSAAFPGRPQPQSIKGGSTV